MAQVRAETRSWMHARCCPCCGYAGWELQLPAEESAFCCPNCDQDLYARPALSYAQREGLIPGIVQLAAEVPALEQRTHLAVRVWRGVCAAARRVFMGARCG
ncbi:MAG: hypothetical protein KF869_12170 [Phycisphaeraceae bacterium]|nr:hypothetical protein [Phycisphaeraceae bacterium]